MVDTKIRVNKQISLECSKLCLTLETKVIADVVFNICRKYIKDSTNEEDNET